MSDLVQLGLTCRNCDGHGFHEMWVDGDGQGHLDSCRLCYRGRITLKQNRQDLERLYEQIGKLLGR